MLAQWSIKGFTLLLCLAALPVPAGADDFERQLKPFFANHCIKCHGGDKVKGKVNLKEIGNT